MDSAACDCQFPVPAANYWMGGSLQDGTVPAATQATMTPAEVAPPNHAGKHDAHFPDVAACSGSVTRWTSSGL